MADHLNFYYGSLLLLKWHIRLLFLLKMLPGILLILTLANSFNKASYQVLHRLQSCSRHVRDLHWQESLTAAPAEIRLNALLWSTITQKQLNSSSPLVLAGVSLKTLQFKQGIVQKENIKITIRSNQLLLHESCVGFNVLISFYFFRFHKGL